MGSQHAGSCVYDCAAQFPHRHRRHDQDLVGRRLCAYRADGFDGKILRRRRFTDSDGYTNGDNNSNPNSYSDTNPDSNTYISVTYSYSHTNTDAYADSHIYDHAYCYGDANTDFNANNDTNSNINRYCNSYSHADGNINPVYWKVFTNTEASTNSGAAPVGPWRGLKSLRRELSRAIREFPCFCNRGR